MVGSLREEVLYYARRRYGVEPEYLWARFPGYAALRHSDNRKWFGLVMDVPWERLGLDGDGRDRVPGERVDILNVKVADEGLRYLLVQRDGFLPGYHISRGGWISILLDGTVDFGEICDLLEQSFDATASARTRKETRPPKEWLVPANPKYYDIVHAFDGTDEIDWKQGRGIRVGDTVYMYAGAPVKAILYCCEVTRTGIPCEPFDNGKLQVRELMRLRLVRRYEVDEFPYQTLRDVYGVSTIRGPRGVPPELSHELSVQLGG